MAKYSAPVVSRLASERHDWEIFSELGGRLFAPPLLRTVTARCLRSMRPERVIDALLRIGPYRLSLNALRQAPHGLDLGPLQPRRLAWRLASIDRRIDRKRRDESFRVRLGKLIEQNRRVIDRLSR